MDDFFGLWEVFVYGILCRACCGGVVCTGDGAKVSRMEEGGVNKEERGGGIYPLVLSINFPFLLHRIQ